MPRKKLRARTRLMNLWACAALLISGTALSAHPRQFAVLHAFEDTSTFPLESRPQSLLQTQDGNLYGIKIDPLSNRAGIIFKIDLAKQVPSYSDYFRFAEFNDGSLENQFVYPRHLTQARSGSFYVSGLGRGIFAGPESLFKITAFSPPKSDIISSFPTWRSDSTDTNSLLEVKWGKFYTTTVSGGGHIAGEPNLPSGGAILEIDTTNSDPYANARIVHTFDGFNGANPGAGLIRYRGSLYGTTCRTAVKSKGTINVEDKGVIFRYDLSGKYTVLHRFDGTHGGCPRGGLLRAKNGKLYGTTWVGGSKNQGVIFEFDINRHKPWYQVLHNFNGIHGSHPRETLVQSAKTGRFYGVTYDGGNADKGVIFTLDVQRHRASYSVLHEFDGLTSGEKPEKVVFGKDCSLYGTASGGPFNGGLVYKLNLTSGNRRCYNRKH